MRTSALLFTENGHPMERFARVLKSLQIPGTDLQSIDAAFQARFFQKKAGTNEPLERWDLEKVVVECPEHLLRQQLGDVGFIHKTFPTQKTYEYAAWPGALVTRAAGRFLDLIEAWKSGVRWNQTIVFGGKRTLNPEKENVDQCLQAIVLESDEEYARNSWKGINPETELDMMTWMWHVIDMPPELRRMGATFVDAPMKPPASPEGKPVRPNTEDTILTWLNGEPAPKPGSILVSSGAPYGMAQNEAFWMLLGDKGFTIETFGHCVPSGLGLEVLLREVAGTVNRIRKARKS